MSRTVIFDFDGTIADTLDIIIELYREMTGDHRHLSREEIDTLRKLPIAKLIKTIDVPLYKVPALLSRGRKLMRERVADARIFPGMKQLLKDLTGQGYVIHIVSSNSQDNVQSFLEKHKLTKYFVEIHGSIGLFQKSKVLHDIATRGHITPHDAWYVGDEARDITAAKKAGLRIASVTWGYQHVDLLQTLSPTAVANSPTELKDILTA